MGLTVALLWGCFGGESLEWQSSLCAQVPGFDSVPNTQTTGGIFVWQDLLFFQEWHLQRSVLTGEFRLLDPQAVCRAAGSREFCEKMLQTCREEEAIPPMKGRVLILLHGFASGSVLLENMALWFRKQGGYSAVLNVSYPTTCVTVESETAQIAAIVKALDGVERIDFVGHSLGSLILRYYLGNYQSENRDPRIGRFVQICPPNQGSGIAQRHGAGPVGLLFPILSELALNGQEMKSRFGIPACEFGILAGYGETDETGVFYGEENDSVLPVSTTRLDGAADWKKIRGDHSSVPNQLETFENVRNFLNSGQFL